MSSYVGQQNFKHDDMPVLGVLFANLGTPDAPTPAAVRRYLAQFLWDPRVVEIPRAVWWLILHGFVLPFRPKRSAHGYAKVWRPDGAPLLAISRGQQAALQEALGQRCAGPVRVALGMRYGTPSLASALEELRTANAQRILVLPAYPQYSGATTASTFDAVADTLKTWRRVPELRMVGHYHDEPGYIAALCASVREFWGREGEPELLLFSFHGMPRRTLDLGDPYFCQCQKTARLVAEKLGLTPQRWRITFQSRFGRAEWLQPYTDKTLQQLPAEGIRKVDVMCPGFAADCLETLEEIAMTNRATFLAVGGEQFRYIPCLNGRPDHIAMLAELVMRHAQGWPETTPDWNASVEAGKRMEAKRRALELGAAG